MPAPVYVSSSAGNDSNPGTSAAPIKTLKKAGDLLKAGAAKSVMLRRGDTWFESLPPAPNGSVFAAYGLGQRPMIRATGNGGYYNNQRNLTFLNLHFRATNRNYQDAKFNPQGPAGPGLFFVFCQDITVEGCVIENQKDGIAHHGDETKPTNPNGGRCNRFVMRRCMLIDNYSTDRAQGLYLSETTGAIIEENFFDHNGWYEVPDAGGKKKVVCWDNIFSHNCYMQSSNADVVFRGNISGNASSHGLQLRAGGACTDNVFFRNAIHLSAGQVSGLCLHTAGGVTIDISQNVMYGCRDIKDQIRGVAMCLGNAKGGQVNDNLIFHHEGKGTYQAVIVTEGDSAGSVGFHNVGFKGNACDWLAAWEFDKRYGANPAMNRWCQSGNVFQPNWAPTVADPKGAALVAASAIEAWYAQLRNVWLNGTVQWSPDYSGQMGSVRIRSIFKSGPMQPLPIPAAIPPVIISPSPSPPPPPPTPALAPAPGLPRVVRLVLIDAKADKELGDLVDGRAINMWKVGDLLNVRADLDSNGKSVNFALDGPITLNRTESGAPFAMAGDRGKNDFVEWTPHYGEYTLTVTPYSAPAAGGVKGQPLVLKFSVVACPDQ